jgi:hypothetical protein
MPKKLLDKYTDPEGYEEEQARRMRARRLRDEAYDRRWRRARDAERARPIGKRRFFSFAEIAERLARDPRSLTIDHELRERIAGDLVSWVQNRQFVAGEVATLRGRSPDFRPLRLTPGVILVPDAELLFLSRGACCRYVEARAELPGAAGLLRDWFASEAGEQVSPLEPEETTAPASPRSGVRTNRAAAAEKACGQWIARLKERPPNIDTAFKAAKAAMASVGTLSRKAFDRAWASAARAEWKRGGRRKKAR